MRILPALPCALVCVACVHAQTFSGAAEVDQRIERAVQDGLIPGAVVVIGHNGQIVYQKAYGSRALIPQREPMTVDTIFDAASLTKVIATTPSLMKLFEQGKIRIDDPVTKYLPEFQGGKSDITIRDLMTHFSGLRPDLDLKPAWSGYETGIQRALIDKPAGPPGVALRLQRHQLYTAGRNRAPAERKNAERLRAREFLPAVGHAAKRCSCLRPRCVRGSRPPKLIQRLDSRLRGEVHDDTARYMGGVAGHAGLFTTAADLAKFAQMMLGPRARAMESGCSAPPRWTNSRRRNRRRISRFCAAWAGISIRPIPAIAANCFQSALTATPDLREPPLWIDPFSRSYVIILTNVVHPHRGHSLTSLRSRVATIVAASLGVTTPGVKLTGYNDTIVGPGLHREVEPKGAVLTGLDVLAEDNFAALRGKRIGLITNQTGLSRDGKRNIDLMLAAGVQVTALFSPEHGINGAEDRADVSDTRDSASGLPVFSLLRASSHRIQPEMLDHVDALVFDIQDVGARFYTYSCTMLYSMEEAARRHLPFFVLDRPNPITGTHVEGPMLDPDLDSFTGCFEIPLRHGMTLGELAAMANGERKLGADLHVVPMRGWNRGDWFDATGLAWVDPSPNMRSLKAAILYPGLAMLEASTNYSVGRGTDSPFELLGADWIHGRELAGFLNGRYIPGVRAYPVRFRPSASNFSGKTIEGVRFVLTNRDTFDSTRLGLEVAYALGKLYPSKIAWQNNRFLIGNHAVLKAIQDGADPRDVLEEMRGSLEQFIERREKYLLYR